jgi:hypothetical protein
MAVGWLYRYCFDRLRFEYMFRPNNDLTTDVCRAVRVCRLRELSKGVCDRGIFVTSLWDSLLVRFVSHGNERFTVNADGRLLA